MDLGTAFLLGIYVTEHVNGIVQHRDDSARNEEMIEVLQQVAKGEVMLYETPEEFVARFRGLPDHLRKKLRAFAQGAPTEERRVAQALVENMLG